MLAFIISYICGLRSVEARASIVDSIRPSEAKARKHYDKTEFRTEFSWSWNPKIDDFLFGPLPVMMSSPLIRLQRPQRLRLNRRLVTRYRKTRIEPSKQFLQAFEKNIIGPPVKKIFIPCPTKWNWSTKWSWTWKLMISRSSSIIYGQYHMV